MLERKNCRAILMVLFLVPSLISCQPKGQQTPDQSDQVYGVKSNYLASGKEPEGSDYYVINKNNDRSGNFFTRIGTIPSESVINIRLSMIDKELGVSTDSRWIAQINIEEFMLDVYDLETNSLEKTIDAKEIMNRYKNKIQLSGLYFDTQSIDGMPYLGVRIEDYPETLEAGMDYSRRMLWINLDTEEYMEDERIVAEAEPDETLWILRSSSFLENNLPMEIADVSTPFFASILPYWPDYYCVDMRLELLPDDNEKLYYKFPSLKEQVERIRQSEGEGEYWIRVYFTNSPTAEEIMGLFTPGGRPVSFEGIKNH